ncbi:BTAD domain-containing putative transcriptional regulator [Streptomyces sp. NPDC005065]|uniref:AfsR/SARP family transcriptional regulator n=1 Tax=unclassified Streptomyces TaxID=2593676 RepID=UPI0033B71255
MPPTSVRFQLLGPLEVIVDGRAVALTGRQRGLLAALLLDANRVVSVARLVDRLWGEKSPSTAAARVRALVTDVRRALGPRGQDLLVTSNPGYLMRVAAGELDVAEFTSFVEEARRSMRAGRPLDALDQYDKALTLWRGDPIPDLSGLSPEPEVRRLEETWTAAMEGWAEACLALGRNEAAAVELSGLVADHPLRERPRGQLMVALHRCGRVAEALGVYQDFRRRLVDELGVEPTVELRKLHQRMLEGDDNLAGNLAETVADVGDTRTPVPRQLPSFTARFIGRAEELRRLDEFRTGGERIILVVGPAGVGKTTLALHWATQIIGFFPDGQLYLDMRGFDKAESMSAAEALPLLLQGLGQAPRDVPIELGAQIALYRSLLASRRLLLVFDNVANVGQVRELLPGGTLCLAVVTSRDRLGGLVALEGAQRLTLDVLEHSDALGLFSRGVGSHRVGDEPEAAGELVDLCDRLPLALCIAMSWVADQEYRSIRQYVSQLTERGRLARLSVEGDEHAAVRAALDLSYGALSAPGQRAFRLLGLVPNVGVSSAAAAAQVGSSAPVTEDLLSTVARVHLIRESTGRRFSWHDLVREYAADRSSIEDSPAEREAAVRRLMDHYLRTIVAVTEVCGFQVPGLPHDAAPPTMTPSDFSDPAEALSWFDSEWENIALAVSHVAEHGPRRLATLVVEAMQDLLHHRRTYAEWLRISRIGLAAAQQDGDLRGQAAMYLSLGQLRWRMADLRAALEENEHGLELSRRAGWRYGEAMGLQGCGVALKQLGEPGRALPLYRRAVEINRELGFRRGEARCLNNLASAHLMMAHLHDAEESLLANLPLSEETGDRHMRALTLVNLGLVLQQQARFPEALGVLREALEVARAAGLPYAEAVTHETFGWVHSDAGRQEEAIAAFGEALQIAERVENQTCQVDSLTGMAGADLRLGRVDSAVSHLSAARGIAEGSDVSLVGLRMGLARVHHKLGRHQQAQEEAGLSLQEAIKGSPLDLPRLHGLLGAIHLGMGDGEQSVRSCDLALDFARRSGQRLEHARTLITLGHARRAAGDEQAAQAAWQQAHDVFGELGSPERQETAALVQ